MKRLWAGAGRACVPGLYAVQLALSIGCGAILARSFKPGVCAHCHHGGRHINGDVGCSGQRVYAQHGEPTGLSQPPEHNGDNRYVIFKGTQMVGGGAFQPYLPDKDSLQGWVGSVSSGHDGSVPGLHAAQEALLTLVCDTSYSHVLRGPLLKGMQPFDKGRGFSHQEMGQQPWEQEQRRGQVRLQCRPPAASCVWRGKTPSSR
ncbi:hypothetical protein XENOCAPTIV_003291 [Xenoophorus captivus]|uniref:Uncharacterized protein n=1 Tax=Xenoophorus captivus TaxID=1517983 RepID=A0ABV0S4W5_9TELE